ncbi:hypothetical protein PCIT_b0003 [Pseudoalteromonas citrea]|uniref:Uncharacterized protein n=1 Tax=Pseudoalteromonas citrea TaxID=43655 RepID=A0AAD4ADS5_9GAMM|nr:hypothetical protein PCIT_b0003 [Pseudoalteromonas citrea]
MFGIHTCLNTLSLKKVELCFQDPEQACALLLRTTNKFTV